MNHDFVLLVLAFLRIWLKSNMHQFRSQDPAKVIGYKLDCRFSCPLNYISVVLGLYNYFLHQ